MFVTRKNLNGGRKLKEYPLYHDQRNGCLGYKIGYCEGCNEPLGIRTLDLQEVLAHLFYATEQYKKLLEDLKPKISFKRRLVKWIIGKQGEMPELVNIS